MKFREDARWSEVIATSMGVRITPEERRPTHVADRFYLQATSAESNVGSVAAALGEPVMALTAFVEGSPISQFIRSSLAARGIAVEGPERPQGGPWGYRHQFNIADSGYGNRAPRVWNDRAGEVGLTLAASDFDLERIFGAEGVRLIHISGLIAALSPDTCQFCLDLVAAAKRHGTVVSFDLNYRASFWRERPDELRAAFRQIASQADILIGNEEDFQLALGIAGPAAGDADDLAAFPAMIDRARESFPEVQCVATTLRSVDTANHHQWGAMVWHDGEIHVAHQRPIEVMDRVGGGDGFVGGFLYGLLQGWDAERAMRFGWATGAMAVMTLDDYALPADEAQVWAVWDGNARVQR